MLAFSSYHYFVFGLPVLSTLVICSKTLLTINLRKQFCTAYSLDSINAVGAVHEVQIEIFIRRDYLRT